ncbi:hypothetical protein KBD59_02270 [Candidatus Gracilibacteria bacterium]|nr:hypothetical protein [Candidatus Gracilibacteria bacterium]
MNSPLFTIVFPAITLLLVFIGVLKLITKHRPLPAVTRFSIGVSAIVLAVSIFRWNLVEIFTPFLEPLLELVVLIVFVIALIWSLIFCLMEFKRQKKIALLPVLINIATLIIVLFVPFTAITLKINFYLNLDRREEVVEMIKNGAITPTSPSNDSIALPGKYKYLSSGGGDVIVENNGIEPNVFFFTYRGVIDNFAGFAFQSGDSEPQKYDFGCEYVELQKIKDHWFWMSCT